MKLRQKLGFQSPLISSSEDINSPATPVSELESAFAPASDLTVCSTVELDFEPQMKVIANTGTLTQHNYGQRSYRSTHFESCHWSTTDESSDGGESIDGLELFEHSIDRTNSAVVHPIEDNDDIQPIPGVAPLKIARKRVHHHRLTIYLSIHVSTKVRRLLGGRGTHADLPAEAPSSAIN